MTGERVREHPSHALQSVGFSDGLREKKQNLITHPGSV